MPTTMKLINRIRQLLRKPKTQSLPVYQRIPLAQIPTASTILFYGGNKITELFGNRIYKHPYHPPAFHAALYISDDTMLNVGKFKTLKSLSEEFASTRRVDVITYDISDKRRAAIARAALKDITHPRVGIQLPDYSFTDYLRFGVKIFKPSKKDFCSENVVELFEGEGVKVSDLEPYNTAPWDLQEFAEANQPFCRLFTVHLGPDFPD